MNPQLVWGIVTLAGLAIGVATCLWGWWEDQKEPPLNGSGEVCLVILLFIIADVVFCIGFGGLASVLWNALVGVIFGVSVFLIPIILIIRWPDPTQEE